MSALSLPGAPVPADGTLLIAERFGVEVPTFQGEGPSGGRPALFIRLSRCNLACARCDTKQTWDWSRYDPREVSTRATVSELARWALSSPVELVVITGGEPLLQQQRLLPLVRELLAGGKRIEFETNGTIAPVSELLVDGVRFNVSPKLASFGEDEGRSIVAAVLAAFAAGGRAAFKFVASSPDDLGRIAELVEEHQLVEVWVMPEGTTTQAVTATLRAIADEVAARHWNLTPRLHTLAFENASGR
ncbi:7-carboxy-7-deazaguanine synthase QueE [Kitasatospora sp. NPDC056783]|uniref:7-carboxy-7-deazaguanine synthase QueE n=1 Tax=Kitasatospora sp. NPDC056783 TaxID=3345943 RepID=UPI003676A554